MCRPGAVGRSSVVSRLETTHTPIRNISCSGFTQARTQTQRVLREALKSAGAQAPCWGAWALSGTSPAVTLLQPHLHTGAIEDHLSQEDTHGGEVGRARTLWSRRAQSSAGLRAWRRPGATSCCPFEATPQRPLRSSPAVRARLTDTHRPPRAAWVSRTSISLIRKSPISYAAQRPVKAALGLGFDNWRRRTQGAFRAQFCVGCATLPPDPGV